MKIVLNNCHGEEVALFRQALSGDGVTVDLEYAPRASAEMAGPAELVQIYIDPESLKLIFEYGAALISIYKAHDYFGEAFKGAANKIGEVAGARLVEALSALWKRINKRIRAGDRSRVYFSFEVDIGGRVASIDNAIFPSHIHNFSPDDQEQAFNLVILKVLPALEGFAEESSARGIELTKLSAMLLYSQAPGGWKWLVRVAPIGSFSLSADGGIHEKPDLPIGRNPFLRRRLRRIGLGRAEIRKIVERYASGERGPSGMNGESIFRED